MKKFFQAKGTLVVWLSLCLNLFLLICLKFMRMLGIHQSWQFFVPSTPSLDLTKIKTHQNQHEK
jgi:hypothetical protein